MCVMAACVRHNVRGGGVLGAVSWFSIWQLFILYTASTERIDERNIILLHWETDLPVAVNENSLVIPWLLTDCNKRSAGSPNNITSETLHSLLVRNKIAHHCNRYLSTWSIVITCTSVKCTTKENNHILTDPGIQDCSENRNDKPHTI